MNKQLMKNIFVFILILFSAVAYSQTIDFQFTDGTRASYNSADVKWVTHTGATLNLELKNSSTINYNTDDIVYYNFNAEPVLLTSTPSLSHYGEQCVGDISAPLSYTITGYQLAGNVQVSAPTDFEISSSSSSGFGSSLTLTPVSGNLNATVYVRFNPTLNGIVTAPYTDLYKKFMSGLVYHTSTGALSSSVGVTGTGIKTGTWIGPSRGDWVNAANWCGGIPDSTTDVHIPYGDTIVVNNTAYAKSLTISNNNSMLRGGSSTLSIYGTLNNVTSITFAPQTGTIAFKGSLQEQRINIGEFYNLTVHKTSGHFLVDNYVSIANHFSLLSDSLIVDADAMMDFDGTADFNDKTVILKSDASGTATILPLPNEGNDISGATKFTIERYIPANQKWRGLSVPLSSGIAGNSIYNNWQNNGNVINGQGVLLWSPTSLPGFSLNTNQGASQNIRRYVGGTGFELLTSTTTAPLFSEGKPVPYLVFVTDSYKQGTNNGNMGTTASPTTLRATGTLFKGNYNSGTLVEGFHMIPNPYPASIILNNITSTTNLDETFYVWDPLLFGFRGYGGYQTLNRSSGLTAPGGGSYAGGSEGYIPSGSAFWVFSNGGGSLILNETLKNNSNINIFGRRNNTGSVLRVNLHNAAGDRLLDGVAVAFSSTASAEVDNKDSKKFGLIAENIFIRRKNQNLAIECRPLLQAADTIDLGLHQLGKQSYQLQIIGSDFTVSNNMIPVLEDQYLNKQTILDLNATNTIDFTVDNQPTSSGNRFRIVFRSDATTSVSALEGNKGMSLYPNPVQKGGVVQLQLNNQPAGEYRLVLFDISGVQVMNKVLQHGGGTAVQSVWISDNLAAGNYMAELTDMKGKSQQIKITIQ